MPELVALPVPAPVVLRLLTSERQLIIVTALSKRWGVLARTAELTGATAG